MRSPSSNLFSITSARALVPLQMYHLVQSMSADESSSTINVPGVFVGA